MSPLTIGSNQVGAGTVGSRGTTAPGFVDAAAADLSAEGSLVGAGRVLRKGLANLSATSDFVNISAVRRRGAADLSASGTLAGQGTVLRIGKADLSAVSNITGLGTVTQYVIAAPAALDASSALSGFGRVFRFGSGDLSGAASVSGRGTVWRNARPAALSAHGDFTGRGDVLVVPVTYTYDDVALWPCPVPCGGWMHPAAGQTYRMTPAGPVVRIGPFKTVCDNCGFSMDQPAHPIMEAATP